MSGDQSWGEDRDRFVADHVQQAWSASAHAAHERIPADLGPLAEQFSELAAALLDLETVTEVLQRVVDATVEIVPGAELASVTLRERHAFVTPSSTDPQAEDVDLVQYATDEGPCLEAVRTGGSGFAWSPDLAADSGHWPTFGPRAAELGLGAVLGVGLFPGGRRSRLGALNIYTRRPHGLDAADRNIALLLASHASVALARAREVTAAKLEATRLTTALESRDVIGQATGILMERHGFDAGEAFDILRSASQNLDICLTEVAATFVDPRPDP